MARIVCKGERGARRGLRGITIGTIDISGSLIVWLALGAAVLSLFAGIYVSNAVFFKAAPLGRIVTAIEAEYGRPASANYTSPAISLRDLPYESRRAVFSDDDVFRVNIVAGESFDGTAAVTATSDTDAFLVVLKGVNSASVCADLLEILGADTGDFYVSGIGGEYTTGTTGNPGSVAAQPTCSGVGTSASDISFSFKPSGV